MWDQAQDEYNQVQGRDQHHEGSLGHEILAGAGAFGAFKMFEDHQRKEGTSTDLGQFLCRH